MRRNPALGPGRALGAWWGEGGPAWRGGLPCERARSLPGCLPRRLDQCGSGENSVPTAWASFLRQDGERVTKRDVWPSQTFGRMAGPPRSHLRPMSKSGQCAFDAGTTAPDSAVRPVDSALANCNFAKSHFTPRYEPFDLKPVRKRCKAEGVEFEPTSRLGTADGFRADSSFRWARHAEADCWRFSWRERSISRSSRVLSFTALAGSTTIPGDSDYRTDGEGLGRAKHCRDVLAVERLAGLKVDHPAGG
jgi:hypothetical protein